MSGDINITNQFIHTKEEPTTLAFHDNSLSNTGIVLYNIPIVLRNLSITNTSTVAAYVHIYNMDTAPTSANVAIFLVPLAPNLLVSNIFNEINHSVSQIVY